MSLYPLHGFWAWTDANVQRPDLEIARALWLGVAAPWRLAEERLPPRIVLAASAFALAVLTLTAGAALGFATPWAAAAVPLAVAAFVLPLKALWTGPRWKPRQDAAIVAAAIGPLLWIALALMAVMSVRGPLYLWYAIWAGEWLRPVIVTAMAGLPLWSLVALAVAGRRITGRARRAAAGAVVTAGATALFALALLAPGADQPLSTLNRPLALVPMTHAVITGIATYGGLPAIVAWYPVALAGVAVLGGWLAATERKRRLTP
jgi:hypothetical protein